jgi:hypothetical protein
MFKKLQYEEETFQVSSQEETKNALETVDKLQNSENKGGCKLNTSTYTVVFVCTVLTLQVGNRSWSQ